MNEIAGALNYWLTPGLQLIRVSDHMEYVLENLDLSNLGLTGNGDYPTLEEVTSGESDIGENHLYEEAFRQGYVRVVISGDVCTFSGTPTAGQLRELRNLALDRNVNLQNDKGRWVDL